MLSQLNETLQIINSLNKTDIMEEKINQNTLKEQQQNLQDLKVLLEKYSEIIKTIKNKDKIDKNDLTYFIAHVHAALIDLVWHIEEIDDLLRTFSKSLSKKES